jgi:hypothetical protein
MAVQGDSVFEQLESIIKTQSELIQSISKKLQQIESIGGGGGGGGNATISDYEPNKDYERNTLVVDVNTETVYRVLKAYKSKTVEQDCINGNLKLVGFESGIVTYGQEPSQTQVDALPEDTLIAIYNSTDDPYNLT